MPAGTESRRRGFWAGLLNLTGRAGADAGLSVVARLPAVTNYSGELLQTWESIAVVDMD